MSDQGNEESSPTRHQDQDNDDNTVSPPGDNGYLLRSALEDDSPLARLLDLDSVQRLPGNLVFELTRRVCGKRLRNLNRAVTELQLRLQNVDFAALRASDFAVVREAVEAWNTPKHALIMSDNITSHAKKKSSEPSGIFYTSRASTFRPLRPGLARRDLTTSRPSSPCPRSHEGRPRQRSQPTSNNCEVFFSEPPRSQQPPRHRFDPTQPQQPAPPPQQPPRYSFEPPPPQSQSQATPSKLHLLFGRPLNFNLLAEVATFLNLTF